MKIAILYICTGKYEIFWKSFYESSEKYFLIDYEKTYFVFTDALNLFNEDSPLVKKVYQENLGWPGNTLFRYKVFNNIDNDLTDYDYVFFFNANMILVDHVGSEILPEKGELLVTQHPGYYNKHRSQFTYDVNPQSLAFIPKNEGDVYVCGGFNGGMVEEYRLLIKEIMQNTQKDYDNGIVALWHDESHLNKYIIGRRYKILSPSYAYPEGLNLPFDKKIVVRDKRNFGGSDFLRGTKSKKVSIIFRIFNKIRRLI